MRALPAIRFLYPLEPTEVGHEFAVDGVAAGYEYEALLISQPHWRTASGGWTGPFGHGGGPFWQERIALSHYGRLEVPSWFYFGIDYGRTVWKGVGRLYADQGPPYYGAVAKGPLGVGRRIIDAQADLKNLTRDNYTRGILRTRPGVSQASFGQFIAELRDLPKIPGQSFLRALRGRPLKEIAKAAQTHASSFLGATANEYLNWEFGWRPFVKDLQDFRKVLKTLDTSLARLVAENNKNIRRRASLGSDTVITPDVGTPWSSSFPMWNCGGYGSTASATGHTYHTATTTRTTTTWFCAGYRYSIRDTSSWLWKGKAAAVLLGVLPTPKLLYDITPWTWLLNWTGEADELGQWLSYVSPTAVDALVTRYAFTMRTVVTTEVLTSQCLLDPIDTPTRRWQGTKGTLTSIRRSTTKQRGTGWSPFGNSYPSSALTKRQLAVLAALGISRATSFTPY
jgi:hypothetical protein